MYLRLAEGHLGNVIIHIPRRRRVIRRRGLQDEGAIHLWGAWYRLFLKLENGFYWLKGTRCYTRDGMGANQGASTRYYTQGGREKVKVLHKCLLFRGEKEERAKERRDRELEQV